MKNKLISEVRKFQKIAGILKEDEDWMVDPFAPNTGGTTYEFLDSPKNDPLVAAVIKHLSEYYNEGPTDDDDWSFDPRSLQLHIKDSRMLSDPDLVELLDKVFQQPKYQEALG